MEQGLQIFDHPQYGEIRVTVIDGKEWFFAPDVCRALEVANVTNAMKRLDEDEIALFSIKGLTRGNDNGNFVDESGLYNLVLGSRKKEAKAFKRWITHEVLPSVRRHGAYLTPETVEKVLSDPDTIIRLATQLKEEREARAKLEARNAVLEPKGLFADSVAAADTDILVGELAKILRQNGVNVGQNRLYAILRDKGYLCKMKGLNYNLPTQRSMDLGLFRISESTVSKADGTTLVTRTTRVTGKGQQYFVNAFLNGPLAS